jgi:hypothetical protein
MANHGKMLTATALFALGLALGCSGGVIGVTAGDSVGGTDQYRAAGIGGFTDDGTGGSTDSVTGGSAGSATGGSAGSATGGSAGSATGGSAGSATGGNAGSATGGSGGARQTGGASGAGGSAQTGGTTGAGGSAQAGGTTGAGGAPAGKSPFKGIAHSGVCEDLTKVGATWFYTWSTRTSCKPSNGAEYVPQYWGSIGTPTPQQLYDSGFRTLLTFNEPDQGAQANMSVDKALSLWPQLEAVAGLRLCSPGTSSGPQGKAWLESFMTKAAAGGHRVDIVCVHWYGWGGGGCNSLDANFRGYINWAMKFGKPVWITEFGCYKHDAATVRKFYNDAVAWLATLPQVERYAWFLTRAGVSPADANWAGQALIDASGNLTPIGQDYLASQAYK